MDKMKTAFRMQERRAAERGIEFKFTFEEWVAWWELQFGPDWMKYRGRRACDYVMARKGDVGAYEAGNVTCVTASQNLIDRRVFPKRLARLDASGKRIYSKLTATKAKKIYEAEGAQNEIARQFDVSARLVRMIKAKQVWKHATDESEGA